MALDYSNEYLYWSQTELAKVTLRNVFDAETESHTQVVYNDVVVRRDSMQDSAFAGNGFEMRSNEALYRIPRALIGGNQVHDGDILQIGSQIWRASNDIQTVTRGSSISFYRVRFVLQQG